MLDSQPNTDQDFSGISKRLAKAREAAGKTAKECASILGITIKIYQKMETGATIPSLPELEALAYFFGILHEDILEDNYTEFENKAASAEQLLHIMQLRHRILSATLQLARSQKNLSLKELSNRSGISIAHIKRYELTSKPIPLNDLITLCNGLEISIQSLFDQSGFLSEGQKRMEKERSFHQLPAELQEFFTNPENLNFLQLAKRLKETGVENLESLADGLQLLANKVKE
jgi:transcriptional regulator with XRE-family HTH domain